MQKAWYALIKKLIFREQKSELETILYAYKGIFFWLFFFSSIINLILILPALYMFQIYDSVLTSRSFETLLMLSLIVIFFFMVYAFLLWARSQMLVSISRDLDEKLSGRVFQASFKAVLQTNSLSPTQLFNDLANLRQFLTGNPIFAFFDSPFAIIYIFVIFLIHPVLGIFSIMTALLVSLLTIYSEKTIKEDVQKSNKEYQDSQSFLQANFRNAEVIEAMSMHENIFKKWKKKYENMLFHQLKASNKAGRIDSLIKFVRISSQSLILGLGAFYVINNKITPGMMIMASILMGRALSPVDIMVSTWRQFISARQSYNRLKELLLTYPPQPQRLPLPVPKGEISVENLVVVAPNTQKEILRYITFSVEPGEIIAIIGPTASGKSTLAKALANVWQPVFGSIKLDGASLNLYNKEHLGQYIGYLPQDVELFSGTIAENIARFGEIDMELVVKAALLAGIHDMILRLPQGYETEIGEGGSFLSGGQRQRIALARAFYGDPILLVLDEPDANLDEEGERALLQALLYLKKEKKTIFVITHRPGLLAIADKIMILSGGSMQVFGPREEVLKILYEAKRSNEKLPLIKN